MSILKRQVSSSSIFVSLFIVMTRNSTVNLKLLHFLFWTKGSYQSSNFDTFRSKHSSWWRRLKDVLMTSFVFVFRRRLQDVFKTSWSRPIYSSWLYVFKTTSRRLAKTSSRHLQDVFKTYHQVKLFLLTRLWETFNTFLRRSFPKTIIYRGICPGNTTSDKFMVSIQNLQER